MAAIEHVFVLVMENRSFDHILGYSGLYGRDSESGRQRVIDGVIDIPGSNADDLTGDIIYTEPWASFYIQDPDGDLGHDFPDVLLELCGPKGSVTGIVGGIYPPVNNSGFVDDYQQVQSDGSPQTPLLCFNPLNLPILNTLAHEFAVCDRWFAAHPGPTWPNRFYVHGASPLSANGPSNGAIFSAYNGSPFMFNNGTIYDQLLLSNQTFALYKAGSRAQVESIGNTIFWTTPLNAQDMGSFESDLQDPSFNASYIFIEPDPGETDWAGLTIVPTKGENDMHPPSDVRRGELFIKRVYEGIRNSPLWESSVLIVTFDEHGGFFDHVAPPPAVPPDDGTVDSQYGFQFNQLGVRVPAIVISPFVTRSTIDHTMYDHTSILRTTELIFGLQPLTDRDWTANDFRHLFNESKPRQDTPAILPTPGRYLWGPGALLNEGDPSATAFFVVTVDGRLFQNYWDDSARSWAWADHGTPPLALCDTAPATLIVNPADPSTGKLFVGTADGRLFEHYWDETTKLWTWADHGFPPGGKVGVTEPGALIVYPTDPTVGRFFLATDDGRLVEHYWNETAKQWNWADHGFPPGTKAAGSPGALIINPADPSTGKFFLGTWDGRLFEHYWDETTKQWDWDDHGFPPGGKVGSAPGALFLYPTDPTVGRFFLATDDGRLVEHYWDGTINQWNWTDHGKPPTTWGVATSPGAVSFNENDASVGSFFIGTNDPPLLSSSDIPEPGRLFERYWDETTQQWNWVDHGRPPNTRIATRPTSGAVILGTADPSTRRVFLGTNDGGLVERYWDTNAQQWNWSDHGLPFDTPKHRPSGVWQFLGQVSTKLAVGGNADGRLQVFTLNTAGELWTIGEPIPLRFPFPYPIPGWTMWESLGGAGAFTELAVGANADGRIQVFTLNNLGELHTLGQASPNGRWNQQWESLRGAGAFTELAVGANADGRIQVFTLNNVGRLETMGQISPNGRWSPQPESLGGVATQLAVGANADGRIQVFTLNSLGELETMAQISPNGSWNLQRESLGEAFIEVAVGANADGRIQVFTLNNVGELQTIGQIAPNGSWGQWESLGGAGAFTELTVGANTDGRLQVFTLNNVGELQTIGQIAPNGSWGQWESLGGTSMVLVTLVTRLLPASAFVLGTTGGCSVRTV